MPQTTRTWLGFAAIGAGLVHLALVVGSPVPLAVGFALLGTAEFGWGVVTLARDGIVLPRVARIVAITPVMGWGLLLVFVSVIDTPGFAAELPFLPMGIAALFGLFLAAVLSLHLRRAATDTPAQPGAARYLVSITAGAVVVGALTAPALAATEAGRFAQPHGAHTTGFEPVSPDPSLPGLRHPSH